MFDEHDYNRIVTRYYNAIFSYCLYKLALNVPLAEETASDVMITLYKKWDTLDRNNNIRAWLYRVADICIMRNKQLYYKDANTLSLEELQENHEEVFGEGSMDISVLECLSMLPKKYHDIFKYKYIYKMTEKEIGEFIGIPTSTVRSRLLKAKEIIQKNFL